MNKFNRIDKNMPSKNVSRCGLAVILILTLTLTLLIPRMVLASHVMECDPNARYETLSEGDQGPMIFGLQTLLLSTGFDPGDVDGIFDVDTRAAVESFQRSNELPVDGVVSVQTWSKLCGIASYSFEDSHVS